MLNHYFKTSYLTYLSNEIHSKNVFKGLTVVLPLTCIFKPMSLSMTVDCLCLLSPRTLDREGSYFRVFRTNPLLYMIIPCVLLRMCIYKPTILPVIVYEVYRSHIPGPQRCLQTVSKRTPFPKRDLPHSLQVQQLSNYQQRIYLGFSTQKKSFYANTVSGIIEI